jgi:heme-degrading monooxygenase HmoA
MEAGFKLRPGIEDDFWRAQGRITPIVMEQPGFVATYGGPIARSSWLYFSGRFETPDHMDAWYHERSHKPVQRQAHTKWFSTFYIRKWRLPAEGEPLGDRIFNETHLMPPAALEPAQLDPLLDAIHTSLTECGAASFETLTGEFEPQPYQLIGPVEQAPQEAPVKYLLLTHWTSQRDLDRWLGSPCREMLERHGTVTSETFVPIPEPQGSRPHLRDDGLQRDWVYDGAQGAR